MTEHAHTNRLINETSPYLLQHAHNPVDWFPWGEEAFEIARREQKPILLSIGYSACHWCHVMEHESFENEAIAKLMNENFVNIKVDREERPDLDQIYMNAVQMMTHHGGWPMTVFLTPEAVPFYAGTYFPPEDRYNMPGFPRVLISVADAYRERPDDIQQTADFSAQRVAAFDGDAANQANCLRLNSWTTAYRGIIRELRFNQRRFWRRAKVSTGDDSRVSASHFLSHRQSSKLWRSSGTLAARWPKAASTINSAAAFIVTRRMRAGWCHTSRRCCTTMPCSRVFIFTITRSAVTRLRATVAEGILDYVVREMTDPAGGFYSTQDADSEGVEGKFFVWSLDEVKELLGESDAALFAAYYNVTDAGNFEGENILNVTAICRKLRKPKA